MWPARVAVAALLVAAVAHVAAARDFYKILGVPRDANERDIKRAYRKLSVRYHPDKDPSEEAKTRFAEISEAYQVLSNDEKRRVYDQHGEEGVKQMAQQQGGGGGGDPFDLFSSFFGGGRRQQRTQSGREQLSPIFIDLPVTLKDLYVGRTFRMRHKKTTLCPKCRGTGAEDPDAVTTCPKCRGQGVVMQTRQLGPGFIQQMQMQCDRCGGRGKIVKSMCKTCGGTKLKHGHEADLIVLVEEGMPDEHDIVLEQEGDEHPDYAPADLHFVLRTQPHPLFTRNGNDLRYKMTITLLDALVGFSTHIEHLDGHHVKIQRASVTRPGLTVKVVGEGMPHFNFPSEKGDLYVTFTVAFPSSLTDEQKEAARKLLADVPQKNV